MNATLSQTHPTRRFLDRQPWRLPSDPLVELLALDARPRRILQVGADERTSTLLAKTFPDALVVVSEPDRLDGHEADAILCAFGLTATFKSDARLADELADRLPLGGHLALLELEGASTLDLEALLRRSGIHARSGLVEALGDRLAPLHVARATSWMGLWRHLLYVGRKGSVIR
ncbi:MAG: hypothetical protein H6737_11980 [Alphaproteobacteria bacterium]|nr:hypothetical protein [Alphaproteobacteria bacterium]MCB9683415.1 hypothetical protein [Alphaproteobacteria bacterium]